MLFFRATRLRPPFRRWVEMLGIRPSPQQRADDVTCVAAQSIRIGIFPSDSASSKRMCCATRRSEAKEFSVEQLFLETTGFEESEGELLEDPQWPSYRRCPANAKCGRDVSGQSR